MVYLAALSNDEVATSGMKAMTIEMYDKVPSPRLIRPHMPFYLLHPDLLDTCKVVYVARNPKDVIVSFYHHHRLFPKVHGYAGTLEEFAQNFMDDQGIGIVYAVNILIMVDMLHILWNF